MRLRTLTIVAAMTALLAAPAFAHSIKAGSIEIEHPWSRATAGAGTNGAIFMTLTNQGTSADRLLSVTSSAAERVELHSHIEEDGVMKMRQINAIELPAGATVLLGPGRFHAMLFGLKAALIAGQSIPLTLTFEKAGSVSGEALIQGAGDTMPEHCDGGHDHSPPEHKH